jgi:mannose-6-phosphate isomerase-like protein (cupin superfamily)
VTILTLPADAGVTYSFLGTVATVKAGATETAGTLTVLECECPPGWATPMHLHESDDEAFYVVSGLMRLWDGDDISEAGQGSFVLAEKNRPHAFAAGGDEPLRILQLNWPSGFEQFVADTAALPAGPPDPQLLSELAARQGIRVVGPPPV